MVSYVLHVCIDIFVCGWVVVVRIVAVALKGKKSDGWTEVFQYVFDRK